MKRYFILSIKLIDIYSIPEKLSSFWISRILISVRPTIKLDNWLWITAQPSATGSLMVPYVIKYYIFHMTRDKYLNPKQYCMWWSNLNKLHEVDVKIERGVCAIYNIVINIAKFYSTAKNSHQIYLFYTIQNIEKVLSVAPSFLVIQKIPGNRMRFIFTNNSNCKI